VPAANEPVDPRIRLAIVQWPEDAPRGAVTSFCEEHQISRTTFYAIRARARDDGAAAALEPRSRRPKTNPAQVTDEVKQQALAVRAALESSGLAHGPISVHDQMHALALAPVPSVASLARLFREAGVARLEPRKRPRAAWRRFVYPAPNACWQRDATEYVLTGGRTPDPRPESPTSATVGPAAPPRTLNVTDVLRHHTTRYPVLAMVLERPFD